MALSHILQKITDETNKKIAFMKQVTEDEIRKIGEETQRKADEKRKDISAISQKKCLSVVEKAKVLAKMENSSNLLKEKREVLDSVYSEVQKELDAIQGKEYIDLLVDMLKSVSEKASKGNLIIPDGRKKETEEALSKSGVDYHIKEESRDFKSGFIVFDSKSEINFSFSYLLNKVIRPSTELTVAKTLFE
ncbi:V-type ATP synthase subunit E [Candidatus Peregrinibacteria bacterium]|nr:V-type ATP synthase subunit E [Candidatus Peregrinibacteria bacterium]